MVKENGMVMMTAAELERMEREHLNKLEEYEKRIELLREALKKRMTKGAPSEDVRVARIDFLALYNEALEEMFDIMENERTTDKTPDDVPNDIYGYDITVHWHGIYCNCGDGATPSNILIPAIEEIDNEDPTEY